VTFTKQLAKEFNVSEADLVGFAKLIAGSLSQDGVKPEQVDGEMVEAYAVSQVKKTDRFVSTYLTNAEARETLKTTIRRSL